MKLAGLNTLVTGGSQGLGKEIAAHFLREGANVVICARNAGTLATARAELALLAAPGRKILAHACDVADEAQVEALAAFTLRELGSLQVLVNNAGIYGPMGPTESVSLAEWRRAIDVNLFGVLLPCRTFIPHFKAAGRGTIVIVSGGGATTPMPNVSAYAASKAAVVRLMETLAGELRPFGVDVNAVAPGALNTRLLDEALAAGREKVGDAFFAKLLQQRESGGVPLDKGAALAVYLASAASDGVTGRLISAQWDPWSTLHERRDTLAKSDIYTLRRIVPEDRGQKW